MMNNKKMGSPIPVDVAKTAALLGEWRHHRWCLIQRRRLSARFTSRQETPRHQWEVVVKQPRGSQYRFLPLVSCRTLPLQIV